MSTNKINVKKRDLEGTSSSRRLRRDGILPGILYGSDNKAIAVEMDLNAVETILHHHSSETILIDIDLEDEGSVSVLMKEIQHHPVTSSLLHVDLQRVKANKPIQLDISLDLKGEPEGVKAGGILDHILHTVSIQCLPADVVESIEVNISDLEIGDIVTISDLNLSSKLTILTDIDSIIAAVNAPKVAEEEEVTDDEGVEELVEPEVITEKEKEQEE